MVLSRQCRYYLVIAGDQFKRTIYVGSGDDTLYALSVDGALEWCYGTNGWILSSPAIGSDGTVYVGSMDGALYAIMGTGALASSPWPKFHHDSRNSSQY